MKELIKQEVEKEKAAMQAVNVRNLMETTSWSVDKAMDVLHIPAENCEEIKKRIEENR
jgi:hypothetical protein